MGRRSGLAMALIGLTRTSSSVTLIYQLYGSITLYNIVQCILLLIIMDVIEV